MSAVKSQKNKSTELKLIKIFKENNLSGWRRNYPIFGKPDFVYPKFKIAIFADGCFWHGHNCRNTKPADNADYWSNKRDKNKRRDLLVTEKLISKGWHVVRFWECELQKKNYQSKLKLIYKIMDRR